MSRVPNTAHISSNISATHDGVAAMLSDLVSDGMRLVVASHVIDDDVGAGLRHCYCNRLADAGIGARDERLLTGKRHARYGRPPDNLAFPDVHFALPICMREN